MNHKIGIYKVINKPIEDQKHYEIIFFKVFRSVYIRKIISYHLEIFNHKSGEKTFDNFYLFYVYPYKDYMKSVKIRNTSSYFNLKNFILPPLIEKLELGQDFNKTIRPGLLENSTITHLKFGNSFNQPLLDFSIPITIKQLEFGNSFNQPILSKRIIPKSCTAIFFGNGFNQPLYQEYLQSVTTLELGEGWKFKLQESIPSSVTTLFYNISRPIELNSIPTNIERLILDENFNQFIEPGTFGNTNNLKTIEFNKYYDKPIAKGTIPNSVTIIKFAGIESSKSLIPNSYIPASVHSLFIDGVLKINLLKNK